MELLSARREPEETKEKKEEPEEKKEEPEKEKSAAGSHAAISPHGIAIVAGLILVFALLRAVLGSGLATTLFVICVPGYFWGANIVGGLVKDAIQCDKVDKKFLGVNMHVGSIAPHLIIGRLKITDVKLDNPEGFTSEYLFNAKNVTLDLDMMTLVKSKGQHIIVQELTLAGVDAIVEKCGYFTGATNVSKILDHLGPKKPSEAAKPEEEKTEEEKPEEPEKKGPARTIEIRKVRIVDVGAKVATKLAGVRVAVGDIVYENFSEEMGAHIADDVIYVLVSSIAKSFLATVTGKSFADKWM